MRTLNAKARPRDRVTPLHLIQGWMAYGYMKNQANATLDILQNFLVRLDVAERAVKMRGWTCNSDYWEGNNMIFQNIAT